jgi:hypothetical protein
MRARCASIPDSLWLLLALAACESPTGVRLPAGSVQFTPPSVYREWWTLTEQCSGRQASFDAISGIAAGDLVRHEMLHAILGGGGHPRDMFVRRCGGVVVCIKECLSDGGSAPPPDPAARSEPASTLDLSVEVVPAAPASSTWDGYLMMIVRAHNPASYPIVAQTGGFGYHFRAPSTDVWYDLPADAPEETRFAAGETKSLIFDFHIVDGSRSRYDIAPGTWTFNGSHGAVWAAAPPTVTVSP